MIILRRTICRERTPHKTWGNSVPAKFDKTVPFCTLSHADQKLSRAQPDSMSRFRAIVAQSAEMRPRYNASCLRYRLVLGSY